MAPEDLGQGAEDDGGLELLEFAHQLDVAEFRFGAGPATEQQQDGSRLAAVRVDVFRANLAAPQPGKIETEAFVADFEKVFHILQVMMRQRDQQAGVLLYRVVPLVPMAGEGRFGNLSPDRCPGGCPLLFWHLVATGENGRVDGRQAAAIHRRGGGAGGTIGIQALDDLAQRPEAERADGFRVAPLLGRQRGVAAGGADAGVGVQCCPPAIAEGGGIDRETAVVDEFERQHDVGVEGQELDAVARVAKFL